MVLQDEQIMVGLSSSYHKLGNQNSVCAPWIEYLQPKSQHNYLIYLQLLWIYCGQNSKQRQLTVYFVTVMVLQDEAMVGLSSSYHNIS